MTEQDWLKLFDLMKALFPKSKPEQVAIVASEIEEMDAAVAEAIIRRSAKKDEFIHPPELLSELRIAFLPPDEMRRLAESLAKKRSDERALERAEKLREDARIEEDFWRIARQAGLPNVVNAAIDHASKDGRVFIATLLKNRWNKYVSDPKANPLGPMFMNLIITDASTALAARADAPVKAMAS